MIIVKRSGDDQNKELCTVDDHGKEIHRRSVSKSSVDYQDKENCGRSG